MSFVSRMKKGARKSLTGRAVRYLGPYVFPRWTVLLVAAVALLAGAAFELLKPWPLKFVFDYLLKDIAFLPEWMIPPSGDERTWMLVAVCASILLVAALSSAAAYFQEYLLKRMGEEVAFELRVAMFSHVQRLSLRFHDTRRVGDVITRVTEDTSAVRELATGSLIQVAVAVVTLAGMLIVMFWLDWQLALVGTITIPIMAPVVWYFRRQIEDISKKRKKREVEVTSLTQETMTSIRMVKAFGREAHQQKQFGQESSKSAELGLKLAKLEAGYVRAVDMIGALATCVVVWWGVHRIRAGALTPGDLLVFVQYVRGVYAPIRDLAKQSAKISKGKVALERILEVLEKDVAVKDSPTARPAPALRGRVEFQSCCFEYKSGQQVLHDVSFRAEPGEVVALVGLSGAGKSTIMSLIPRLYDPTSGRVLIDGADLRDYQQESLRDQISMVLQDSILLQTTIVENILYGRPDATMEEVYSAAVAAGVDQFVHRLSDGYQTVVGPRGATLSGGERQRVAVARAMVRGAPILLLDEPTTGLDVQSESAVMQALGRLMQGKTTLVISHKLDLIKRADRILVIEGGRIVQSGTHDELIAARGPYAHLHDISANGRGLVASELNARAVET